MDDQSLTELFDDFRVARRSAKPSPHTERAARADFTAIHTEMQRTLGKDDVAVGDVSTRVLRLAFAAFAGEHSAASIARAWSTWNQLFSFLVAEEIVSPEVILSDPNRILLPPHKVAAVVHEPGGAYPSPVQGYYARDHAAFGEYHQVSRSRDGFLSWLQQWVFDIGNRPEYVAKLGSRFEALRPTEPRLAAAVDYG